MLMERQMEESISRSFQDEWLKFIAEIYDSAEDDDYRNFLRAKEAIMKSCFGAGAWALASGMLAWGEINVGTMENIQRELPEFSKTTPNTEAN
jgi:hypothetical protein